MKVQLIKIVLKINFGELSDLNMELIKCHRIIK